MSYQIQQQKIGLYNSARIDEVEMRALLRFTWKNIQGGSISNSPVLREDETERENCPPANGQQMSPKSNSLCPGNGAYDTIFNIF